MKHLILKFLENESGATAIEYSLIAAGIAVVIVGAVNGAGSALNDKYASFKTALTP